MYLLSKQPGFITKDFKRSELNHSGYASSNKIKNVATGYAADNQVWLAIVLQLIRDEFNVPIVVTSGYRGEEVNKSVEGSKTSAHVHGSAADIQFADIPKNLASQKARAIQIVKFFNSIGLVFDQVIYYKSWIHVGMRFRSKGRRQIFEG